MLAKFCVVAIALATSALSSPLASCKENCARSFGISSEPSSSSSGFSSSSSSSSSGFSSGGSVSVWSPQTAWSPQISFSGWEGHASLDGFDNFYGVGNFDGTRYNQISFQGPEVVCSSQRVNIIQQRLAVIRELAKKVIVEQICDVETQAIVFEQFHGNLGHFKGDLRRVSGRKVGFDNNIVGHFKDIIGSDGFCTTNDFGFSGQDIGRQFVCPVGNTWRDDTSFVSVNDAYLSSRFAHRFSSANFDF